MNYKIISFYSEPSASSQYYTRCAKQFKANCENLGLKYSISELPSQGNYYYNTHLKPGFILDHIQSSVHDILWVDIDSHITKVPQISEEHERMFVKKRDLKPPRLHVFSGAIYLKNNETNVEFVTHWKEECESAARKGIRRGDHPYMVRCLDGMELPFGYLDKETFKFGLKPSGEGKGKKR